MRPGQLFSELQRRHVLRVIGAYAFAAWIAVEVYTTVQPILLENHEWTNRYVVLLAILGFPVCFALAWIFDITPHGVRRTAALEDLEPSAAPPAPASQPARRHLTPRATGFFGLGILVALVGFAAYAGVDHLPPIARSAAADEAPIRSIAVLPFADLSSSRDQEFFSDGIAEELLNRLTQVPDLSVPARTSSFAFKGRNEDVREIGRRLGVEAILEGSVRREGDRVRVQASLISVANGYQLWGESFEGSASDVFALQDQISEAIVDALRMRITATPEAGERGTKNARAMDSYLLGLQRWHQRTDRDLRQALAHLEAAVEEDPNFALAHAAIAQTYALLPLYGAFPMDTAAQLGWAAAARAIDLDPSLGDAYAAMGQIAQNFEWDLHSAERYYKSALRYSPSDPTAHQWYAETLLMMGRTGEARSHLDKVLAANPLAPASLYLDAALRTFSGRVDEGVAASRDLVRRHPDFEPGAFNLVYTLLAAGQRADAAAAVERLGSLLPDRAPLYAAVAAALRDPRDRAAALRAVRRTPGTSASERAVWLLALGDHDGALAAIERSFETHTDPLMLLVLPHPVFRPLRAEARFRSIVDEVGITLLS